MTGSRFVLANPNTFGQTKLFLLGRLELSLPCFSLLLVAKSQRAVHVEAGMTLVMIGALLVLGGVVFMAAQPLWRGRLSSVKRPGREVSQGPGQAGASDTLEPRRAAGALGSNRTGPVSR